ncbi:MAG: ComF family protein [Alistipes sp.]|nr:ComF family protein [Alistipes sp.]
MSTLSDILRDAASLFVRRDCMVCGQALLDGERDICTACNYTAPLTGFAAEADNALFRRFGGTVRIERAAALVYFIHGSHWQRAIHGFKYRDKWRWAYVAGLRLGAALRDGGLFAQVDTVVPVPLHARRLLSRGYNQSEYIARGVAEMLGARLETGAVVRRRNNPSQTTLGQEQKRENVRDLFAVKRPGRLEGRNILLVDDVITTGETVIACTEAIAKQVECRISVAAFAASRSRYGGGL